MVATTSIAAKTMTPKVDSRVPGVQSDTKLREGPRVEDIQRK